MTFQLQILAVGMLDVATFGMDAFFVQINEAEVMHYQVHRDGRLEAVPPEPQPLWSVAASIEKFNHGYLLDTPVPIAALTDLPRYLGKFEITSDTTCRYTG